MNSNKLTDNHTLYFWCKDLTTDIVKKEFRKCIKGMNVKRFNSCDVLVRVVEREGGFNYGYARIGNEEVFHCICGRNPDGSERVIVEHPHPLSYYEEEIEFPDNWDELDNDSQFKILEDFYCSDDAFAASHRVLDEYDQSVVKTVLDPLFESDKLSNLGEAFVDTDDNISTQFIAQNVPRNVSVESVRSTFEPFVSDKNSYTLNNKKEKKHYPIVWDDWTHNGKRNIHVSFAPRSYDGYFAFLMNRICPVQNGTLYFKAKH